MRSATESGRGLIQGRSVPPIPADATQCLWTKFHGRNIYSTCWRECFRRSTACAARKKLCIHRLPHRLCTSYATYCTGYPQSRGRSGFAVRHGAASVAGYLFSGAGGTRRRLCSGLSRTAARSPVEKLWTLGITLFGLDGDRLPAPMSEPSGRCGQVAKSGDRAELWERDGSSPGPPGPGTN